VKQWLVVSQKLDETCCRWDCRNDAAQEKERDAMQAAALFELTDP